MGCKVQNSNIGKFKTAVAGLRPGSGFVISGNR